MAAGRGIIVKVVEKLFREVAGDVAKGTAKTAAKDAAKAAAKNAGRRSLRSGLKDLRAKARQFVSRALTRDPIDVATGEVLLNQTDVELAGALPLVLERTHVSSYREGRLFGISWASTLDQCLEVDSQGVCFASADGMVLAYPHPPASRASVLPAEGPRWPLTRVENGGYTITDPQLGRTLHFPAARSGGDLPLVAISDRNGNRIDLVHDEAGMPVEIRHSGGYRIAVDSHQGRIRRLRLLTGGQNGQAEGLVLVRYGYDDAGHLAEVFNSSENPLLFGYDAEGRLTRWQDRNGFWYGYTYDSEGRGIRGTGSDGFLDASLSFDPEARRTVVTDSLGHPTTYHFNDAGQVIAQTDPLGRTTVQEWDPYDRLLSRTDPLGRTTWYSYDARGNLTEVTRPDGRRITADHNDLNLPLTVIEEDGAIWRQEYDSRGNLTVVTDPLGAVTRYTYDDRGAPASTVDALGNTVRIRADAAGLPVAVTDPMGATTTYARDAFGRVSTISDPVGGITRLDWTIEGRLTSRTSPSGAVERWAYDDEGNLTEHTDAAGRITHTEHAHFDTPTAKTTPDGARLEFTYDTELRLVAVTNPQGLVWRYDYDPVGNLIRETDFNDRTLVYAYDRADQLISRVNGLGESIHYQRDLLDNVVEQRGADQVTTFAYDPAGRLLRAVSADTEVRFDWDLLGRVVAETCDGRTLTNVYDPLGRRVYRRTPTGAETNWRYDDASRPVALQTAGQTLHFGYDLAGREVRRDLGTGAVLDQRWDADHRLISQTLLGTPAVAAEDLLLPGVRPTRSVRQRAFSYGTDENVVGIDDQIGGPRRFELDVVGRITAVYAQSWSEQYAYDSAGNVTQAVWPAPVAAADGDALGRRDYNGTLIHRAGNVRYEHDAQGRVVLRRHKTLSGKPRIWRYAWDSDDRLVAVETPDGHRWRYRYDPLGRRIAKELLTSDGSAVAEQTDFSWDGPVLVEQTHTVSPHVSGVGRTTTWDYEPDGFRPLTQTDRRSLRETPQQWFDQQFHAIITDVIGSPTELVDSHGTVGWHSPTTLWGKELSNARAAVYCPLRFPGQYHDPETDFNYNHHRYYDPAIARYLSPDPLGITPQPNPHAYVHNPTVWSDPLGLAPYGINDRWANRATFPGKQLQKKYSKHALDFNLPKNYNPANAKKLEEAMRAHIRDPAVKRYRVDYKRQGTGIAFVDPNSGLMVLLHSNGEFWSGWKLGSRQLGDVIRKGWLW